MAFRYSPAQMVTLADALVQHPPGMVASGLQQQLGKGRYRDEAGPAFGNLQLGARNHMTTEWHICPYCAKAISNVLDADTSLGIMVGAAHTGR